MEEKIVIESVVAVAISSIRVAEGSDSCATCHQKMAESLSGNRMVHVEAGMCVGAKTCQGIGDSFR